MKSAKTRKKALDTQIDRLEATFEANRREMLRLAEENARMCGRYEELLEANHRINDRIHTLLEQLWKIDTNK